MDTEKNYLYDLGQELILLAQRIDSESKTPDDQFQSGRLFALYEVLSLMQQQAVAFELTPTQIGLGKFDVESLLK